MKPIKVEGRREKVKNALCLGVAGGCHEIVKGGGRREKGENAVCLDVAGGCHEVFLFSPLVVLCYDIFSYFLRIVEKFLYLRYDFPIMMIRSVLYGKHYS
jgi:hypothetical protein